MPANMSEERRAAMTASGAEITTVSQAEGMEGARDRGDQMQRGGLGQALEQLSNPDNSLAHYRPTAREIWPQRGGRITHFVSSMGTTGTIMGSGAYLKEQNSAIQIVGLQPSDGASIPGIRRWPQAYLPKIFKPDQVDEVIDMSQQEAEDTMRALAQQEGIFCGVSSGGAVAGALRISRPVENEEIGIA